MEQEEDGGGAACGLCRETGRCADLKYITAVPASAGLAVGTVRYLRHTQSGLGRAVRSPKEEQEAFENAVREAQDQLIRLERRAAAQDRDIFMVQRVLLEDEGLRQEVASYIRVGAGAAASVERAAGIFAGRIRALEDPYMRERACDILDACRRVVKVLDGQPHETLRLTGPAILVAEELYPTDIVTLDRSLVLGFITSAGSPNAHAAIIARSLNIPGITQVGRDFLEDCDGREVILNATEGECILDPDAVARQQAEASICQLQREDAEMKQLHSLPDETRDGEPFELLANCFGPEDIDTAMQSGARGVGLLRSSYMMLPGRILDEQEQFYFYSSCLAAAQGCPVTVRTFDFGADRTMADAYQGVQSSKLGLRGIRNSLRQPRQFETQICALLRAAARGPLRVMFPMVTDVEDWDAAMHIVEHCRQSLRERGVPFNEKTPFGVMLSVPSACLTAEEFVAHGCDFLVIGTNDLTQYTHAADRELASAERYYRPASPAMKKLIAMVVDAARKADIPVTICGLAVGNAVNATQYLHLGLRSFSMSPQNLLTIKKALRDADAE